MKGFALAIALAAPAVLAFPRFELDANYEQHMNDARAILEARGDLLESRALVESRPLRTRQDALGISKAETNCGPLPCLTFDETDQEVSVTGEHAYQSPAVSDIRGPCPGLNAAANHGYLPRNGIASIEQTISGLEALYNGSPELWAGLAAYAVAVDGNIVEGVWSIGGPLPTDELTGAILGTGQGLSYSHNNYEGDSSIGRSDAYTNHGDAHSLNITKFEYVYAIGGKEDRYTLDKFRSRFEDAQDESIANNPYYFTGLFSTVVVVPAAYNFVINFMSNHTAEEPSGYLDGYNFKSFFGVVGKPGKFKWIKGQERVPENWYRRPTSRQYTAPDVFEDVAIGYAAYPNTLKIGGNTGKVNTFTGVNVANLTGGVFSAQSLTNSDNLACFAYQILQNGIPDALNLPISKLSPIFKLINKSVKPAFIGGISCPQLQQFDVSLFRKFPGYKYKPKGKATNYKA